MQGLCSSRLGDEYDGNLSAFVIQITYTAKLL